MMEDIVELPGVWKRALFSMGYTNTSYSGFGEQYPGVGCWSGEFLLASKGGDAGPSNQPFIVQEK